MGTTRAEQAILTVAWWKARAGKCGWIIMTRGSKEVLAVYACESASRAGLLRLAVPPIDASQIIDDVGAGDAFMGGFLACMWTQLVEHSEGLSQPSKQDLNVRSTPAAAEVERAVRAGISTAAFALTGAGCHFPQYSNAPSPRKLVNRQTAHDRPIADA